MNYSEKRKKQYREHIGRVIRGYRCRNNCTQEKIGNAVLLSKTMISEVKNGNRGIDTEAAMMLSEMLGFSPCDYMLYDNPLPPEELERYRVYLQIDEQKQSKSDQQYLAQINNLIQSEYGENMRRYIRYMWSIYQLALLNQNREVFESIKQLTYAYTNSELMKYYPTDPDDDKKTGTDD